jgi:SWIM zinc finger
MTPDIARSLAPDDSTLKRAEALASPRKWIFVERNDRALWGECSGSGGDPYRAVVDMNGPAYKCSCPVKRFPCKHALALLLLASENNPLHFGTNPPPFYVTEWIDARDRRQAAKAVPRTEEQIAKSEASKSKNWSERLDLMRDGVDDLQNRLLDILREGLAALEQAPPQYFQDFAARMVDAKLGGLSKRIKSWAAFKTNYPEDWYERLLEEMGSLYLMTKAFKNFERLNDDLQNEIMAQMGVSIKKEDLLSQNGLTDDWLVLGQIEKAEEDNLTSRKVWLRGRESGKTVLVLDFAFGSMGFGSAWLNGYTYRTEVVFYPSAYPLRVVTKTIETGQSFSQIVGYQDFIHFFESYSTALSLNPWLSVYPALLAQVIPVFSEGIFFLIDTNKKILPVSNANERFEMSKGRVDEVGWKLMALSGGKPISVFGEWNGGVFSPLSVFSEGRLVAFVLK